MTEGNDDLGSNDFKLGFGGLVVMGVLSLLIMLFS